MRRINNLLLLALILLTDIVMAATVPVEVHQLEILDFRIIDKVLQKKLSASYFPVPDGAARLITDRNGHPFVLSQSRKKGSLISLRSGNTTIKSDLLKGFSRRSMIDNGDGWLVTVDYWPGGGSNHGGIYQMKTNGKFHKLKLSKSYSGLADIISNPQGGFWFCDFEADNIWSFLHEGTPEVSLLEKNTPGGLMDLAWDPQKKYLYASSIKGNHPFSSQAGIYQIKENKAELLVTAGQVGGLTWNDGKLFPAGIYFTDTEKGTVERLNKDKTSTVVIDKLYHPGDLYFDVKKGALFVLLGDYAVAHYGLSTDSKPESMQALIPKKSSLLTKIIPGVQVQVAADTTITDKQGKGILDGVALGEQTISVVHSGYERYQQKHNIIPDKTLKVGLLSVADVKITGQVKTFSGHAIIGATIHFLPIKPKIVPAGEYKLISDENGQFSIISLPMGEYQVQVSAYGFKTKKSRILIDTQQQLLKFQLKSDGSKKALQSTEPDNKAEQAILLKIGQTVTGYIDKKGDVDWLKLHIDRPGKLLAVMQPHTGMQQNLKLYSVSDTETILTEAGVYTNSMLKLNSWVSPGDYFLAVHEWGDNNFSSDPYLLSLNFISDDGVDDPLVIEGQPIQAVRSLKLFARHADTIWPLKDQDVYQIKTPQAGLLTLQSHAPFQHYIALYDKKGTKLTDTGAYTGGINQLQHQVNSATPLYLKVTEWGDNNASVSPYVIRSSWIAADPQDAQQHNNTLQSATPVSDNVLLKGNILPLKDQDVYQLKIDHPGYLQINGEAIPGQMNIQLLDNKGKMVIERSAYQNSSIALSFPVLPGYWYVKISEWGNNKIMLRPYRLKLQLHRAEPEETVPLVDDPVRQIKAEIGRIFIIDQAGDRDRFLFDVPEKGQWFLNILTPVRITLKLFSNDEKKPFLEKNWYANNKINLPLELKEGEKVRIELTAWGKNIASMDAAIIMLSKQSINLFADKVVTHAGTQSGQVFLSRETKQGTLQSTRVEVDADRDGEMDILLDDGVISWQYPEAKLYQSDIIISGRNEQISPALAMTEEWHIQQRIWVDARDIVAQQGLQLTLDGVKDNQLLEQDNLITAHAKASKGSQLKEVIFKLDGKQLVTLFSAPFEIALPWEQLDDKKHLLEVLANDTSGKTKKVKYHFRLADHFALLPEEGAELTGENIRISWIGNAFGVAKVNYRELGSKKWLQVIGENGRSRSVLLRGLSPGKHYEYQLIGLKNEAPIRRFNLLKGLAFEQASYGAVINRDYDQRLSISLRNNSDKPLVVELECGTPVDPALLVSFVGEGSVDRPFELAAGEKRQFWLALSAQDVMTEQHRFPVRIRSKTGLVDEALINLSVRLPHINLAWKELGRTQDGMGQAMRLINRGDTLTDLKIFSREEAVEISPIINHGLLHAGSSIDMIIRPKLDKEVQQIEANLIAQGLDKKFRHKVAIGLQQGESAWQVLLMPELDPEKSPIEYQRQVDNYQLAKYLDPAEIDWSIAAAGKDIDGDGREDQWEIDDELDNVYWLGDDTNADGEVDFVHADKGRDGVFNYSAFKKGNRWQATNLVDAWLEMGFSLPWSRSAYHKHDVNIIFNKKIIGSLHDTIPNGNYSFRIPPDLVRFNKNGIPSGNHIGIESKHLRGGHYVVNSDFRFSFRLTGVQLWSSGSTLADAYQKVSLLEDISLSAPDYSISSQDFKRQDNTPLEADSTYQLQAKVYNLGASSDGRVQVVLFDQKVDQRVDQKAGHKAEEVSRITLDNIPLQGEVPINIAWTASPGEHQLILQIDPDGETADIEQANNRAELTLVVPGDPEPPSIKIQIPKNNTILTSAMGKIEIQASDETELVRVEVSIDGALWRKLPPTSNDQFAAGLLLQPGQHRIQARAIDGSGNESIVEHKVEVKVKSAEGRIIFPENGAKIPVRSTDVILKIPPGTRYVAVRVQGYPWYKARISYRSAKAHIPLPFGSQIIEMLSIDDRGIASRDQIKVMDMRQPKANDKPQRKSKISRGRFYLEKVGHIDVYTGLNSIIVNKAGEQK